MTIVIRMTLPLVAMLLAFLPLSAKANIRFVDNNPLLTSALVDRGDGHFPIVAPGSITKLIELTELSMPTLPTISVAEVPSPRSKRLCTDCSVSNMPACVRGWRCSAMPNLVVAREKSLCPRPRPVEDAVMVFSGFKRLKRGHVAVVTESFPSGKSSGGSGQLAEPWRDRSRYAGSGRQQGQ